MSKDISPQVKTGVCKSIKAKPFQEPDEAVYNKVNQKYHSIFAIDPTKDKISFVSPDLVDHINKQISDTAQQILDTFKVTEPMESLLDDAWGSIRRSQSLSAKILNGGIRHNSTLLILDVFARITNPGFTHILELGSGNGLATTRLYEIGQVKFPKGFTIFSIDGSILGIAATFLLCTYLKIPVVAVKGPIPKEYINFKGVVLQWGDYNEALAYLSKSDRYTIDAVISNMGLSYCQEDTVEEIIKSIAQLTNPGTPLATTSLRNVIVDLTGWYRKFAVKMYDMVGKWPFSRNRYRDEMRDGVKRTILTQWNEGESCKRLYEFLNYLVLSGDSQLKQLHEQIQDALKQTQKFTEDLIDEVSFQNDTFDRDRWNTFGFKIEEFEDRAYEEIILVTKT
jgi:SAM-dependent methyltransferase